MRIMRKPRFTQAFLIIVVLFALTRTAPVAHAEIGLNIDATALRFIYTPGAGGFGSIGRIDITRGSSSALTAPLCIGIDR